MKTSHAISKFILVVMSALTLAAGCAKKSDDGKSASARGGSLNSGRTGATPVNAQSSQGALDYALTQGVNDFYVDMIYQPQVVTQNYAQAIGVESSVVFNGQTYPLVTYHEAYSNGSVSQMNSVVAGPFTLLAQGVCGDTNCNTYYLLITVTRQGTNIIQLAQRQNFAGNAQNLLTYRKPQEFITSIQMLYLQLGQPTTGF